jgi:hypothetical protein
MSVKFYHPKQTPHDQNKVSVRQHLSIHLRHVDGWTPGSDTHHGYVFLCADQPVSR